MPQKILIMGLPGSGKTTLALHLIALLNSVEETVLHLNADLIRFQFNDWDFSKEGRIRQSIRMRELADNSACKYVIADFVAPIKEMRQNFEADFIIWVDTIKKSRYADTNAIFEKPDIYNLRVIEQDADKWANKIFDVIYKGI
jgi:adenylylsulfate kinase